MSLKLYATITGSYPPLPHPSATNKDSIRRAVHDQLEAGLDILVDGQVEDDIAAIFANHIPGYGTRAGRYPVINKILPPKKPIGLASYKYARSLAGNKIMKAHLTGPTFLAQLSNVQSSSPYKKNMERSLLFDISDVLIEEAKALSAAGADYIQIDEPSFAYSSKKTVTNGLDAIERIVSHITYPILHVCGDIRSIFPLLLSAPKVHILNIEGQYLRRLTVTPNEFEIAGKKIAYGCIPVNSGSIEKERRLQSEIVDAIDRFGIQNLWGVTPNCGLRLSENTPETRDERLALKIMTTLVSVARKVEAFINAREVDDHGTQQ